MTERYSLIVVSDETQPIRRFDVRKDRVRRALQVGVAVLALGLLGMVDYVHVRIQYGELDRLRMENAQQQARIDAFDATVAGVQSELEQVREFERKVRIIANLPESAASGGGELATAGAAEGDLSGLAGGGIDVHAVPHALPRTDGGDAEPAPREDAAPAPIGADPQLGRIQQQVRRLQHIADQRGLSLQELVTELERKHDKLASSPAIWPAKGWLTSRFGTRISPFTGKRQFHAGVDIAGAPGTGVLATARGKVVHAGRKGPMGNTVILDHGYGVRTHYGHNDAVTVKKGATVERGQQIATLGNSGRSTGPHVHYTVEVKGKAVNPLDYIFD